MSQGIRIAITRLALVLSYCSHTFRVAVIATSIRRGAKQISHQLRHLGDVDLVQRRDNFSPLHVVWTIITSPDIPLFYPNNSVFSIGTLFFPQELKL